MSIRSQQSARNISTVERTVATLVVLFALVIVSVPGECRRLTHRSGRWGAIGVGPRGAILAVAAVPAASTRERLAARLHRRGLVAGPVWRRDGRAVALARRGPLGLTVEVHTAEAPSPLIRHVPLTFDGRPRIFWIGPRRVGLGPAPLMPRVVVSWTSVIVER